MNCFCLILVLSTPATGGVLMSYGILSDSCISSVKIHFAFFFLFDRSSPPSSTDINFLSGNIG